MILTSGTTGQPKGAARRSDPASIEGVAAVLERIPFRLGDTQVVAAPLFHAWGLTHLLLGLGRCTTTVLSRRFDAEATLRATSDHEREGARGRAGDALPHPGRSPEVLVAAPTPRLRVIASSGSALGSRLATDALDRFGPVLYNLYGSTEVAVATVATPADLLAAPATADASRSGCGSRSSTTRCEPCPTARSAASSSAARCGSRATPTGGGKEERRGLLSSGDLGHFDDGLLFVEGREDDMIVSGGENVFPDEVEDLLAHHPAVADVAVVGVADDEFGQALAAFVVRRAGHDARPPTTCAPMSATIWRATRCRDEVEFVDELPRNTDGQAPAARAGGIAEHPGAGETGEEAHGEALAVNRSI